MLNPRIYFIIHRHTPHAKLMDGMDSGHPGGKSHLNFQGCWLRVKMEFGTWAKNLRGWPMSGLVEALLIAHIEAGGKKRWGHTKTL